MHPPAPRLLVIVLLGLLLPQAGSQPNRWSEAGADCQPELTTSKERVACYQTTPFGTAHGVCTVATIAMGKIK